MTEKLDRKILLSTLWVFILMNMIYADIVGQLQPNYFTQVTEMSALLTSEIILVFSILLEIPIGLILLSRILNRSANRIVNFIGAPISIAYVVFGGLENPPISYLFFGGVEIVTMLIIMAIAWRWKNV
ncbi:MAG: DUF6326 family protein [Hyphomicrobiales bacterium]